MQTVLQFAGPEKEKKKKQSLGQQCKGNSRGISAIAAEGEETTLTLMMTLSLVPQDIRPAAGQTGPMGTTLNGSRETIQNSLQKRSQGGGIKTTRRYLITILEEEEQRHPREDEGALGLKTILAHLMGLPGLITRFGGTP